MWHPRRIAVLLLLLISHAVCIRMERAQMTRHEVRYQGLARSAPSSGQDDWLPPDEETAYCPAKSVGWRSSTYDMCTQAVFYNKASAPATILYISSRGEAVVLMEALQPGKRVAFKTDHGKVFRAVLRDDPSVILAEHLVGVKVLRNDARIEEIEPVDNVNIGPVDPESVPPLEPKSTPTRRASTHSLWNCSKDDEAQAILVNRAGFGIELWGDRFQPWWPPGTEAKLIRLMPNGGVHQEFSYWHDSYEARTPDGRHVSRQRLEDVVLSDCPSPGSPQLSLLQGTDALGSSGQQGPKTGRTIRWDESHKIFCEVTADAKVAAVY
eukprot:gnl/TRDRNA2_/TRDRNA2_155391_c1_seq1.p1 gnl/TRDRNA2_/TRDRNA2_155391_c1~~gnl/TRDRNA2_/TRDRNA2_155391_c1_seq1.p1  ORF type:complete len:324 (-),score=53.09 gnl/TRDRNA2_/TRDRNA2_155391_c1_seq1:202-1173(-)